ncbi:unnamed protein product [Paramecium primaurelia]|uniref:Uncharacterized protein n=2 Tax=Paramecium TaxID=5884 RepID=A0A8S1KKU8_PARPR|nr:unnamed protein product [Paramecium primaurelia]CAD8056104.1 unnamed protein product [Paramecium primaurelia]CAD8158048.1 unnamed protein product [Paramecium pentaurelia]
MNFLFSNDDDDGNFDSFITQNLKPEPPKEKQSSKKLQTAFKPIEVKSQFQFISTPKLKPNKDQAKTSLWNIMLQHLNYTNQINNFNQERSKLPYPLNSFFLSKIQEYRNQKIEAIICEIHDVEEFGDTTEITLKDQSGSCKASILSDLFTDDLDDLNPTIYSPVKKIQKKEDILVYLENVTVFSPNEFQITIIINRANLKLAIF